MSGGKAIGLIGGVGPGATLQYYERLTRAFAARGGPHPAMFISHADVNITLDLSSRGELEALARYLSGHIAALKRAGADFATISSILTHICAPELKRMIDTPLLDLIDCVRDELKARSVKRVALLGTRFVMERELFGRLDGFDLVRATPETIDYVHREYFKIVTAGKAEGSGFDYDGVRAVARDYVRRGADIVVLAGTELSLAFDEETCGFPALDCMRAHVAAIMAAAGPA